VLVERSDYRVFHKAVVLGIDDDDTDYCVAVFRAPRSGYLEIQIENLGSVRHE
jgi:hypothetical protein